MSCRHCFSTFQRWAIDMRKPNKYSDMSSSFCCFIPNDTPYELFQAVLAVKYYSMTLADKKNLSICMSCVKQNIIYNYYNVMLIVCHFSVFIETPSYFYFNHNTNDIVEAPHFLHSVWAMLVEAMHEKWHLFGR